METIQKIPFNKFCKAQNIGSSMNKLVDLKHLYIVDIIKILKK
jgi:hypothetical protein